MPRSVSPFSDDGIPVWDCSQPRGDALLPPPLPRDDPAPRDDAGVDPCPEREFDRELCCDGGGRGGGGGGEAGGSSSYSSS